MARDRKLTWDKATKRWCKFYRGRKHYLGYGKGKTDQASYDLALEKWAGIKTEIDALIEKPHKRDYEQAILLRREMMNWLSLEQDHQEQFNNQAKWRNGQPHLDGDEWPTWEQEHNRLARELEQLNKQFARTSPPALNVLGALPIDPLAYRPISLKMFWAENIDALRQHAKWQGGATNNLAETVVGQVDAYLATRKTEAEAGQISPQRYKVMTSNLTHFKEFIGEVNLTDFNGRQLSAYQAELLKKVSAAEWSAAYAKMFLVDVKTFVHWMYKTEVIETVPRILSSLKIDLDPVEPKSLTADEIKTVLQGSTGKTKLYILLMLNLGATQKDLSDLKPNEVDWTNGRIERKRSKTRKKINVPKVNYKLWPETFRLLKEYGQQDGEHVLLNERGNPLRSREFNGKDGDMLQSGDAIRKAMEVLCKRLKIDQIQPKRFRKTSANLLFNHPTYRQFHELFLGHAAKSIAEKNYVSNGEQVLDEALAWLGQQYGAG